jgi:hypothetical protein
MSGSYSNNTEVYTISDDALTYACRAKVYWFSAQIVRVHFLRCGNVASLAAALSLSANRV